MAAMAGQIEAQGAPVPEISKSDLDKRSMRTEGLASQAAITETVSGIVNAVFIIILTVSYAVLIFSGPLVDLLSVGIGYGLVAAAVTAMIFAAASGIPFATAGPDSKPVAVLAALAAGIAADLASQNQAASIGPTVIVGLVFGTLLTGMVLLLLGTLRTAGWIRVVPYPVMGGFLAASGWLLVAGSVHVMTGVRPSLAKIGELMAPEHIWQFATGMVFVVAIVFLRRIKHPLAFPIFLVIGSLAVHASLYMMRISLDEARDARWLIDIGSGIAVPDLWFSGEIAATDLGALARAAANYVALIVVTASTVLLNTMGTEVEARIDVDLDRELRVTGISNLLSGTFGGMVGTLSLTRTMFSYRAGARHRTAGFLTGTICFLALGYGTDLIELIPVPLVGALLMHLGISVLHEWLVHGCRRMPRPDYALLVAILLVIVLWDFVAGIAVGVVSACVIFAISSSRVRVVKRELSRSEYGSRVDRPPEQLRKLIDLGHRIKIMWLHGFLFFGTTNRLLQEVKQAVAQDASGTSCSMLVLDFNQVLGIDSSAVDGFFKLRHLAEREGLLIAISNLPPSVKDALQVGGLLCRNDDIFTTFADLDAALEWCEDRLLQEFAGQYAVTRSADEWLEREIGGEAHLLRLKSYLKVARHDPGSFLFSQGEEADALYIIYSGRVTVIFRTPEESEIRLRSMLRHTIVGEMGLYRSVRRGASVRVDEPTIVYALSRTEMSRMIRDDPVLAHAFHKFVVCTLAGRLDFANREVASLQYG